VPASVSSYTAKPYSYAEARALSEALGLSEPVAVTLVRRGYRTPEEARRFLAADETHPPAAFGSMETVVGRLRAAIAAGRRITVHGDFDVDGVCATTIAVAALRELGADCDWLIPDRLEDGYGLSRANMELLARRGTSLLLTVDCGITAVDEVKLAQNLGIEVVVTDHHQPAEELPDCPILHPAIDGYPFPDLCGTAVAYKLGCALRAAAAAVPGGDSGGGSPGTPREVAPGDPLPEAPFSADLDLVALATVADLVPLVGENRSLVRRGLTVARRAERPGLRALMAAARCEPERLDEGDVAFRLAPRINAAGRLYRADAGVELFLTADEGRAAEIASELSRANGERRATEREVDAAAEAALRELPEELRSAPAIVVAGEGWHPGVVGIVASRLVERHHRPAIVIALDGEGGGRGSGRSIPGFDLLAGLRACGEHLAGFGGHRAAAGLELREERLDDFRRAFAAHAADVLAPEDLVRTEQIDAMVGGPGLGIGLAEELGRLAPFGSGNPGVRLLVPSAHIRDQRTMGEDGRHARFSLHSGSHRALGVAFGRSSLGVGEDEPVDAAVRLEVNHWNGSVEPRLVLREVYPLAAGGEDGWSAHRCAGDAEDWWRRFVAELDAPGGAAAEDPATQVERRLVAPTASAAATIAELLSSGASVLAVCADAARRAAPAAGAAALARFNGGRARSACGRCCDEAIAAIGEPDGACLALVDHVALEREPGLPARFEHVVLLDPPCSRAQAARAARGEGYLHQVWDEAGRRLALSVLDEHSARRPAVISLYRDLRARDVAAGGELLGALRGAGHGRSPEVAARCFRILAELELVHGRPGSGGEEVRVVSSEGTALDRSATFRALSARHDECKRYLELCRRP
jgi:single-stranded-DNA-specific exonuclease